MKKHSIKNRFPMKLQFFAQEQEIEVPNVEDIEIEDQPEQDEPDVEEQPEETQDEPQEEQPEEEPKTVPLDALIAEREKWKNRVKEYEKYKNTVEKLSKYAGVDEDTLAQQLEQLQAQQLAQQGLDPQLAQSIVQQQTKLSEYERSLKKQQRDLEIQQLKDNPLYSDIDMYRDEIEDYADRKGVSMKEAYLAVRGESVFEAKAREIEQRILNNLQKKQKVKVDTSANGEEQAKPKVKLSKEELEVAQLAGMTPEEYLKAKKSVEIF